jgi:hypothetical protein
MGLSQVKRISKELAFEIFEKDKIVMRALIGPLAKLGIVGFYHKLSMHQNARMEYAPLTCTLLIRENKIWRRFV